MSPMSLGKVFVLFFISGRQVMAEQLWSVQPFKRAEVLRADDDWALNPVHCLLAQKLVVAGITS